MNPSRRRTHRRRKLFGAALAAHQRKAGRRHRRPTYIQLNPARRRRRPVRRRRSAPPRMTPIMRRKVSAGVRRYFKSRRVIRASRPAVIHANPYRRRHSRRNPVGSGLMGGLKSAFQKPLLMKAGGAVLASFGTGMLLQKYGAALPGATSKWGRVAYATGIPILAAVLIRKKNRDLAEGLMIGGLVMGINAVISTLKPAVVAAPMSAYPEIAGYGVAGELGKELGYSWYPGNTTNMGMQVNNSPFATSAWQQ